MTSLTRLREVLRHRGGATVSAEPSRAASLDLEALAARLGGGLEDAPLGACPVVRWWLGSHGSEADDEPRLLPRDAVYRSSAASTTTNIGATRDPYHGLVGRASRAISSEGLRVLCGSGGGGQAPRSGGDPTAGLLFFDLETTGLSGGAGTVAFVVGFGCFEGSRFHVWQFVLPSFAGECRLLAAVTAAVSRAHTLVTFNGKSFDVPFIQMRWLYHGLETPLSALRHLDLLHPARRLWGPDTGGLGALEDRVLGFRRRDDVPGFEIPSRYFDYLRSGDPAPLRGVLSHNCLDLVSLGVLTGLACELVDGGPETTRDGRQCLGLGRVYDRGGRPADATACYEHAAALTSARGSSDVHHRLLDVRAEALYRVASARRRQRRHADAARLWQSLIDLDRTPGPFEREALRALAVHHEHRLKDTGRALTFARRAHAEARTAAGRRDVQKRVTRLERRLVGRCRLGG